MFSACLIDSVSIYAEVEERDILKNIDFFILTGYTIICNYYKNDTFDNEKIIYIFVTFCTIVLM